MPALEEKILEGTKDAQEMKGRRRYRTYTDLALAYSKKVIKSRWPEYEAKILTHIKAGQQKETGYNRDKYEPSVGHRQHSWYRDQMLPEKVSNYIEQVVQGRWPEMEQALLGRYQEQPEAWVRNQNLVDGYLSAVSSACEVRYKDNRPANAENESQTGVQFGRPERNEWKQVPFTRFTQDQQCYWPEGEKRLVTRDPGFEKVLTDELRARATSNDTNWTKDADSRYVEYEDLVKMEKPQGEVDYKEQDQKPSWTIWNGLWIGYWGMDDIENYTRYMLENGVEWPEGVDIMEIEEDIEQVHYGQRMYHSRQNWKRLREPQEAQPKAEGATASMKKFTSGLLNKKALVDMHSTPTFLPPRDDMKRHLDEDEQDEAALGVMDGVKDIEPEPRSRRQIDPRINPDGVRAGKRANAPVTAGQMQKFFSNFDPNTPVSVVSAAHESLELPIWEMWGEDKPTISVNTDPFYEYVQGLGKRGSKRADYTDADIMDDLAHEEEREQVAEGKAFAKRHFMEEDYLQQEAMERGITMDDLWKEIGEEYLAEFYGYSYTPPKPKPVGWRSQHASGAKCPICKSAKVKTVDDDPKTGSALIECLGCGGFYSLLSN
jgi:hypothetical protein